MTNIICYLGGTCGDLVTAMFDPSYALLKKDIISLDPAITRFKKPHLFKNDNEKYQYLLDANKYKCIASHDTAYHMSNKQNFISIISYDLDLNMWASSRFKNLHRPHVWEEMSAYSGARTITEYAQLIVDYSNLVSGYTTQLITLSDIVNGRLLDVISQWNPITDNSEQLYKQWLEAGNLHV